MGDVAAPIITMADEQIALGPLRRDLIATYARWNGDFTVSRTIAVPQPYTEEMVARDLARLVADEHTAAFTCYERASGRPIGNASWSGIDRRNRTAEYTVFIGEADCRGRGYGTAITRLMLDYAFTTLGLHSVWLRVYAFNPGAVKAYSNAGFREFGRRRECKRLGQTLYDVIYMECLAAEIVSRES
jgi:RimJ/RimL family protein N-acetyltransferase